MSGQNPAQALAAQLGRLEGAGRQIRGPQIIQLGTTLEGATDRFAREAGVPVTTLTSSIQPEQSATIPAGRQSQPILAQLPPKAQVLGVLADPDRLSEIIPEIPETTISAAIGTILPIVTQSIDTAIGEGTGTTSSRR